MSYSLRFLAPVPSLPLYTINVQTAGPSNTQADCALRPSTPRFTPPASALTRMVTPWTSHHSELLLFWNVLSYNLLAFFLPIPLNLSTSPPLVLLDTSKPFQERKSSETLRSSLQICILLSCPDVTSYLPLHPNVHLALDLSLGCPLPSNKTTDFLFFWLDLDPLLCRVFACNLGLYSHRHPTH